jgi:2-oxoglutarate ferredoxin oxidoreductase subunit beta
MFDNEVYGLTKGQAAPTLAMGLQTKSLPGPNIQMKLNPMMMAYASGFTWIGRGYSYNVKQLVELTMAAMAHPGLAFLDVLQPCPTYNDLHTKEWYAGKDMEAPRPRVQALDESYNPHIDASTSEEDVLSHARRFMEETHRWGNEIPTGVFMENTSVNNFAERIRERVTTYAEQTPARKVIEDSNGNSNVDLTGIFDELAVN